MSLWVKRDRELKSNRKTYLLAGLLAEGSQNLFGDRRDEIAWRAIACQVLEEFWGYCFEHYPDGDVTKAPDASLRDAVYPFLDGTPWARADVRQLLLKSGHLDGLEDGRIVVHDWFEWNGGEAVRMANDRSRKRLQRADAARKKGRTRPHNKEGRGAAKTALAEKSLEEKSRTITTQQQPLGAVVDASEQELRTRLPGTAHEALDGYLRSAPFPPAVIQSILAEGPDTGTNGAAGKTWEIIGQALIDLRGAGKPFSPALLRGFIGNLLTKRPEPGGLKPYEAMRAATAEQRAREEAGR